MSDPSQGNIGGYVRGGFKRSFSMKKSRSDTEGVDSSIDPDADDNEVVAGTLQDGMGTTEVLIIVTSLTYFRFVHFLFCCHFFFCFCLIL